MDIERLSKNTVSMWIYTEISPLKKISQKCHNKLHFPSISNIYKSLLVWKPPLKSYTDALNYYQHIVIINFNILSNRPTFSNSPWCLSFTSPSKYEDKYMFWRVRLHTFPIRTALYLFMFGTVIVLKTPLKTSRRQ